MVASLAEEEFCLKDVASMVGRIPFSGGYRHSGVGTEGVMSTFDQGRIRYNKAMETAKDDRCTRDGGVLAAWPRPVLFVGLLLLTALENALLTGSFWDGTDMPFQAIGAIYALMTTTVALIAALWAKRDESWTRSLRVYDGFTGALVFALVMLLASSLVGGAWAGGLAIVASIAAAVAYGPLVLGWVALYARLPMQTVFTCFSIAYALGSVLSWGLVQLEPKWMVDIMMVAAAVAMAVCFKEARKVVDLVGANGDFANDREDSSASPDESGSQILPGNKRKTADTAATFPLRPVVVCGVVAFVTTFMQNCGPMADVPLTNFIGALLAVGVLAVFIVRPGTHLMGLQQVSLMLAVASVLCLPFSGESLGAVGMAFSMAANLVFLVFAETVLCGIALRYGYNAPWLVGVSVAVMGAASFLAVGASVAFQAQDLPLSEVTLFSSVLALAVLALFLRFVTEADVVGAWGMDEQGEGADSAELNVPMRVFELSCRYGFTKREEEVCALLAQGHNVASIEELLVVSNSTAKSHVAHIYKKMGVHSIQEFRAVFNHS